jgi:hypothetical protein
MRQTEQRIKSSGDDIIAAAHLLIAMVRTVERDEKAKSRGASLEIEVQSTGGEIETWTITIERKASSH